MRAAQTTVGLCSVKMPRKPSADLKPRVRVSTKDRRVRLYREDRDIDALQALRTSAYTDHCRMRVIDKRAVLVAAWTNEKALGYTFMRKIMATPRERRRVSFSNNVLSTARDNLGAAIWSLGMYLSNINLK